MKNVEDQNRRAPAANADILGEDASIADPLKRPSGPGQQADEPGAGAAAGAGAKPGKDINQAGFIKDTDAAKP